MTEAERLLLLTVARALRLRLHSEGCDLFDDLNEALAPFDPLPEHGGDGQPAEKH